MPSRLTRRQAYDIAKEAIELFTPIPNSQWQTGSYTDTESKCCAVGHWSRLHHEPSSFENAIPIGSVDDDITCIGTPFNMNSIITVNDYQHLEYPQATPKARVLAYLKNLIAKYEEEGD